MLMNFKKNRTLSTEIEYYQEIMEYLKKKKRLQFLEAQHIKTKEINGINVENSDNVLKCL